MNNKYTQEIAEMKKLRKAPMGSPEHNKWLCIMYPWLTPIDKATGATPDGEFGVEWNYEWTWLDWMPEGWRIAFGEQMCFEIQSVLEKTKDTKFNYEIAQIKEKWGYLCWYDCGVPKDIYKELQQVLRKYEDLSIRTCIKCGKPATQISTGWISPYCDECAGQLNRSRFISIEDYFKDTNEIDLEESNEF